MKKIFVALSMVAFLVACDDSSSASAENSEPAALSSVEGQVSSSSTKKLTDSSDSRCEECNDDAISSSGNVESSSSEKLSESSSSSADEVASSSSSVTLAMPCKTETEDNCEYGELTDDRDGKTYKTVTIGDQTWMAENLNYAYTGVPYNNFGYTSDSTSWCYDNDPANCTKYGRLYTWSAAMDSVGTWTTNGKGCGYNKTCSPTYPVRGVCPEGWHLPDTTEWNTLFSAVGGEYTAGRVLKSQTVWKIYEGIINEDSFGFSALPAGYRNYDGYYYDEGNYAYFWSSTEYGSNLAYLMSLYYLDDYAHLSNRNKDFGRSVRCLKD